MKIILGFDLEGFNSDEKMIKVEEPLYVQVFVYVSTSRVGRALVGCGAGLGTEDSNCLVVLLISDRTVELFVYISSE